LTFHVTEFAQFTQIDEIGECFDRRKNKRVKRLTHKERPLGPRATNCGRKSIKRRHQNEENNHCFGLRTGCAVGVCTNQHDHDRRNHDNEQTNNYERNDY